MANIIEVSNVSKRYAIGKRASYGSLREEIMQSVLSPFRRVFSPADGLDEENSVWALKDISFAVQEGEVLGVVGRNGAGKSTLLKILSRITGPTEGSIVMRGRVASLLEVGTGFHPELTGRENIFLNGALLGMRSAEIKAKFDEIVAFSEIEKFLDTPVKRYSSGMYVRLAFAVAAHLEPEILIIDEVLAVGDASFQKKCLGKMGDVAKGGRTVLFVSHNMAAVLEFTRKAILLENGRIAAYADTHEAVGRYLQASKSKSLSRELGTDSRTGDNGKLWKFTHARILNSSDGKVLYKKPIEIALEYHSENSFEDVVIGLVISDIFGVKHIHCRSNDNNFKFSTEKNGNGSIKLRIESVYIPPGEYILGLGAVTGGTFSLDYLPDALHFEVGCDLKNLDDAWILERSGLGARLPSVWESA